MLSFPESGAASLADILKQIKQLPAKNKQDPDFWPYLEIKLQDGEAGIAAQNDILNALDDKAAHLCKLVKVAPPSAKVAGTYTRNLEQLRNRTPLDIALDAYLQATGEEMGDELIERFNSVAQLAQKQEEQQPLD